MTGKHTETAGEKVTDNNIHRAKCLERMIMTMNKVILMGRLTKNPEIKYAGKDNDMAVARYMLAVNRRYKRDGEQEADFISCVTFGKSAEFAQKYLHKGMRARRCAPCLRESRRRTIRAITEYRIAMKYLFCVLLALSLAACGKETEDPGLSREEFLDLFPLHEHGEVYVEPFYVRFYYPGGNCLLFPTDILGESPAAPVQYMFLHLDGSDVPPAELIDRAYGVDCAAATTALSFLPDAAGGNYLVADFRYRYAAEQGTQIGERVGEWRIVWGVQRQYRYNGKLYPRVEFQ